MTHRHWTIMAWESTRDNPTGGVFYDEIMRIKVSADTEDEALKKAKGIVKRKGYRIEEVYECGIDHEQSQDMQMLALEMQAKMLKKLT